MPREKSQETEEDNKVTLDELLENMIQRITRLESAMFRLKSAI